MTHQSRALHIIDSADPDLEGDRRREVREIALMRVALVRSGDEHDICVIRNISQFGLSARVYRSVSKGETIAFEMRSGQLLTGFVVWNRNNEVGVEFHCPIDIQDALSYRPNTVSTRRRALPRIDVRSSGHVATSLATIRSQLRDIGQGGASLKLEKPIREREAVSLVLPGLPPISGAVRWSSGLTVGISFNACVAFDQLALWIQKAREEGGESVGRSGGGSSGL